MEMNWQAPEVWRRGFAAVVNKEEAEIAHRLAPGKDFDLQYHGKNFKVAHNVECRNTYARWWANHPKRQELHAIIKADAVHSGK